MDELLRLQSVVFYFELAFLSFYFFLPVDWLFIDQCQISQLGLPLGQN